MLSCQCMGPLLYLKLHFILDDGGKILKSSNMQLTALFSRAFSKPATVINPPSAFDELEVAEQEYIAAERGYAKACFDVLRFEQQHRQAGSLMLVGDRAYQRVNGMALNPELDRLCSLREQARMKRNEALSRRASALRDAGRIR